ncbi:MAG: hypothetical protein LBS97_06020 [Treponema sp.]|jgi:hypothetical protein|nr:hypothetical protein [Treponema sp.]
MAIQPIDLQTLYSQLDTVAKTVMQQQQGAQLTHAMRAAELTRQETEKNTAVRELTQENEGMEAINDRTSSGKQNQEGRDKQKKQPEMQEEAKHFSPIKDPNLGRHVDVLG